MEQVLKNPTFVIHIEELSPERKPFFMNMLNCAGYKDIHIFKGVNGNNNKEVEELKDMFNIAKFDNSMNGGQVGCLLSHLKLLKHIVDNEIKEANIFEDDIFFIKNWQTLSEEYYNNTPKDYDVLFIGCELYRPENIPKISNASCLCTHAYIVTYDGAKKLLNSLLNYDKGNGLYNIDNMISTIQDCIKNGSLKNDNNIKWYCWNGVSYQGIFNKLPFVGSNRRNCGLVFQNTRFKTIVK
jgi:GR25 family glycosyltransferase involved in LPS biosynthesis